VLLTSRWGLDVLDWGLLLHFLVRCAAKPPLGHALGHLALPAQLVFGGHLSVFASFSCRKTTPAMTQTPDDFSGVHPLAGFGLLVLVHHEENVGSPWALDLSHFLGCRLKKNRKRLNSRSFFKSGSERMTLIVLLHSIY